MPPPESRDYSRDGDEAGDEDEEIEGPNYKTIKDAVLFAIDISHSMLQKPDPENGKSDQDSAAMAAIKCAYQLMQQRIISNPSDMMGVLLFGTEKSKMADEDSTKTTLSYPHCYLLTDLDVPAASDVKKLRSLVRDEDEQAELLVPSEDPVAMSNVLFCANQIFTTKAPNFTSRRLFLVTDDDDPHKDDKEARNAAAVRAKDLYDLGVLIELFPIAQPGQDFEREKFYDDIIYRGLPSDPEAPAPVAKAARTVKSGDGISLLQSLISSVNSRSAARRAYFTSDFEIGPGLTIGVKGYVMIKRQEVVKTCYVWVGGEKPQIAVGTTTNVTGDTAEAIEAKDGDVKMEDDGEGQRTVKHYELQSAYEFGGGQIPVTKEEIASFRNFGSPVIRIIGFKPMKLLPTWANCKSSPFIYPDEANYVGSTRVFSALQQTLLKKDMFAFTWFQTRVNARPTLCALIPGEEKVDPDTGEQTMPPGLWAVQLPFADDIRQKPSGTKAETVVPPKNLVDKMANVINLLRLPKASYDPSKYPNPSLQWFYRILQALALEEEVPNDPEDKTLPRFRQIQKRAGGLIKEWNEELQSTLEEYEEKNGGKRGLSGSMEADIAMRVAKRVKVEGDTGDAAIQDHYKTGSLNKLTVAQLTSFMQRKGIHSSSKKKAELVALVEDHFDRK